MALSLMEAARMVGCNRSTILRAIKSGKLSGARDEASGGWVVEVAEVCRLWPHAAAQGSASSDARPRTDDAAGEMRELRARLADAQETIADLRAERDRLLSLHEADQRLLADLHEPPPPRRRWWQRFRKE